MCDNINLYTDSLFFLNKMIFAKINNNFKRTLIVLLNFLFLISPQVLFNNAHANTSLKKDNLKNNFVSDKIIKGEYLLGVGDVLIFKINQLQGSSQRIFIGPDGYINLDEIEPIFAIGLTVKELQELIATKYSDILYNPDIKLYVSSYRPVNVYIYGEVERPGLYTLSGQSEDFLKNNNLNNSQFNGLKNEGTLIEITPKINSYKNTLNKFYLPSLYDAIRASQGLTPYSDLSEIVIIRENSKSQGGGKIKTTVDLWKLFEEGDLTQNINLRDGDSIFISKSEKMLSEKHLKVSSYNLSPNFIRVYVSGNVKQVGEIIIPQGSSLVQAVARAGGKEILSGDVEFIRFDKYSFMEKRKFKYNPKAKVNSYKNPVLISGDIVNVKMSALGYSTAVISKVTSPIVGLYTLFNVLEDI